MLEWLTVSTSVELGKMAFEQVLNLAGSVLNGYIEDFFKSCLGSSVDRLNTAFLRTPMAEAIGVFIRECVQELKLNNVLDTSIEHHYKRAMKQFVCDRAVGSILGQAFQRSCDQIDYKRLKTIWEEKGLGVGWDFPSEDFRWRRVAQKYVDEVKNIIRANPELRALLETKLLEEIARNTAEISPGFDVNKYRERLQRSYGYLKSYALDSTDRVDSIKLWNIFIEQTVREAVPPTRYDLPVDLKRQLQEKGLLDDDLSPEAMERYRRDYFQQPSRKVFEAIANTQRTVILGDPGSGKSSLLQYLALKWVEGETETLPLLIELRQFEISNSSDFLEFFHCGRGADWQFDRQKLHQYLLDNSTLVMFDGLDEIFDRARQVAIIKHIQRFSLTYPQARILVTSRIVGYNPEPLQHSEFHHFTIQPLEKDEIHTFVDDWYKLSMGDDSEKKRLKQRLKEAIDTSPAIANLADNPLLLTMMAILNRRQELPRDRADLYDQASRVLLYHWDVEHKQLQLPLDTIGRREKQEMLRLIAYEMQAGEEGLKGNAIDAGNLTRILTSYLRDCGFSEPREKTNRLIQQLRERNFILCYRGADTYGFVHRTFLEYFCALEIVNRFESERTLSFEQLRDEVFGQHWHDETWHEVLSLICGSLNAKFAEEMVLFLLSQDRDRNEFLEQERLQWQDKRLVPDGLTHVFLAAYCFSEIRHPSESVACQLLQRLKEETCEKDGIKLDLDTAEMVCFSIAENFKYKLGAFQWLKERIEFTDDYVILTAAILAISYFFKDDPETLPWLKECMSHPYWGVKRAAIWAIQFNFKGFPEVINSDFCSFLKECAELEDDEHGEVRYTSVGAVASLFSHDPETLYWLKHCIENGTYQGVRVRAIKEILTYFKPSPEILSVLIKAVRSDSDWVVRGEAIDQISDNFAVDNEILALFYDIARNDPYQYDPDEYRWGENPRKIALEALIKHDSGKAELAELLRDRSLNDSDERLRKWAAVQLKRMEE